MKKTIYALLGLSLLSSMEAQAQEYWVDFGVSEYTARYGTAAKKYVVRTISEGWNNVSVSAQTYQGATTLSSSYFAETVVKDSASVIPTHAQLEAGSVNIYDTENNDGAELTLSITKDSSIGNFDTIQTAKAPSDSLFGETPRPDWVPDSAYGDFIYTNLNNNDSGAFTLTFSGFGAGVYDIVVIGGGAYMGSVYEGYDASALYTLNGSSTQTISGTNAAGGGYAGVLEWNGVEVQEGGFLTLTVEGGYLGEEDGVQRYTAAALNTIVIKMIPEPASSVMSLMTIALSVGRRRRR